MMRCGFQLPRCALVFCLASLIACGAFSQSVTTEQARAELGQLEARLSELQAGVDDAARLLGTDADEDTLSAAISDLDQLDLSLQAVESSAERVRQRASDAINEVRPLLDRAVPDGDASSEAGGDSGDAGGDIDPAVEAVLAPVQDLRSRAAVLVAKARLAEIDARRLSIDLTTQRDRSLVSSALDRGPSPLDASVWGAAAPRFFEAAGEVSETLGAWRSARIAEGKPFPLILLGIAVFLAGLLIILVNNRFYSWQVHRFSERSPTRQAVAITAMTSFLVRLALAIVAVALVAGAAQLIGALDTIDPAMSISLATAAIAVISARALVESVMAPRTTAFRLIAVGDTGARAACFAYVALVMVFAIETLAEATGAMTSPGPNVNAAATFFLSLLTAALLCWLALKLKARTDAGLTWLRQLGRLLIAALGVVILGASLLGYSALSRYLVERIVTVSFVLLIAILFRELFRATALRVLSGVVEQRRFKAAREDDDTPNDGASSAMKGEFWVRIMVDAVVIIVVPPFIMLALGMPAQELWSEIRRLIAGVEIGGQQISLGQILSAIATLASVLLATRLVQRGLEKNILPHTQISAGASNSLITLLGYAGVLIAGIAAISVIGFDLSSLAIIAGALSVGIGFGLQSIVSNFVAGLILLFERPFKIGDWIVTPSGEGTVRKISVRATEVETFDRQSVIVPNAELVSSAFGNWTHKSQVMRVIVSVGVKYGSDTRLVEKLLLEAAESVEAVRSYPPPFVVFKSFGDSALNFELRAFIIADDVVRAPSELRHVIATIFEREDITIPFPQRDLHVDWPAGFDAAPTALPAKPEDDDQA